MRKTLLLGLGTSGLVAGFLLHCSTDDSGVGPITTDGGNTADTYVPPHEDAGGENDAGSDTGALDSGQDANPAACIDTCADSTKTCCSGKCVDVKKDPKNCGVCGKACTVAQFCNGTTCLDTQFANLCKNANGTVVLDQQAADDDAGVVIGSAIAACATPVTVRNVTQLANGVLEPSTNRPILGPGDTFVASGGYFFHLGARYLKEQNLSVIVGSYDPAPLTGDNVGTIHNRNTGTDLKVFKAQELNATHDWFILQLTVEPQSGTLCFSSYGLQAQGTAAAAYYFKNHFAPDAKNGSWYVYEWQDDTVDGPNKASEFTLRFSDGT